MTLIPYQPEKLDQFALRLLDLAAGLRAMALRSQEYEIADFALHDKKAAEWCGKLEQWIHKSQAELDMRIIEARAARRAMSMPE